MPKFQCVTCGSDFELPQAVVDRYPGWKPKFCREHGKKKRGGGGGRRKRKGRGGSKRGGGEERQTPAQVLERYDAGPATGVFTDGSSVPNPGPGGWGVVHVRDGEILAERHGHDADTTNNRMELTALIEGLRLLPEDSTEVVYTDSKLCVNTIEQWAAGWERRGWKRKSGPIKNLELVQELYALRKARPGIELRWIAAHQGNRWNEYADALATTWMRQES